MQLSSGMPSAIARRSFLPETPAGRFGLPASLAVVAYVAMPARSFAEAIVVAVIASSSVAVLVGIATYSPTRRSSWAFVAAAIAVHALAAGVHGFELARGGSDGRSAAITLLAYPPMLVGAWGLSARRLPPGFGDRRWAIVTLTACAVIWLVVVQPTLADGSLPVRAADRPGMPALFDGLLIAIVGRRLIGRHRQNASLWLATVAFVVWGDAHAVVGSQEYGGSFVGSSIAAGSLAIGPILLALAALVPDMAHTAPSPAEDGQWYRRGIRELLVASLLVVATTATVVVAATGLVAVLVAALLLCCAVVAVGADPVERATDGMAIVDVTTTRTIDLGATEPAGVAPTVHVDEDRPRDQLVGSASATATAVRPGVERRQTRGRIADRAARVPTPDQLELVYLPYVDLATGLVVGVETLVRWRHPSRGPLTPAEFLGESEHSETHRLVDDWVVTAALRSAASWRSRQLVGINVGAPRLADRSWVDHLVDTARATGVDADRIIVETSERSLLDEQGAAFANAGHLRQAGFHLAIDDFGRHIGSLRTLAHAPVDVVKIRCGALGRSAGEIDADAVRAAHATGHHTAIVGIDDLALLRRARELGIELGQGFALCRPMPPATVARRFDPCASTGRRSIGR